METTELNCAFVWDCDHCGQENFARGIEGGMDEPIMQDADQDLIQPHLETADYEVIEHPDGKECLSEFLQQRIVLAPKTVVCSRCKTEYRSSLPEPPEMEGDDDE